MWDLVQVAIRNVGRNKRRALITMFTVFLGVSVVMGARALLNGLQLEFKSGLIRKMHGELQVHHRGYQDTLESNPYKILIPFDEKMIATIKSTLGIQDVTPRLRVMGLLNHQKTQSTTPVMISAFDSRTELEVCPRFRDALQRGRLIDSAQEQESVAVQDEDLSEAKGLDEGTSAQDLKLLTNGPQAKGHHQMLVTSSLMRGLQAELGDEVVVLLQDKNNMQQAVIAEIIGVVDYAMPGAPARMAWLDFKTVQSTLSLQGLTSEIAIRTVSDENLEQIRSDLSQRLGSDTVVETWLELSGFLRDVMSLQNMIFNVVLMIVFLIVISAIINTSLMTVMERTREIGTLMALGYQRRHIMFLFLCEAAVIGIIGGTCGIVLITLLLKFLSLKGLVFEFPGQVVAAVIYPYVSPIFIVKVFFLALAAALGASLYPAYRASHMRPVEALSAT